MTRRRELAELRLLHRVVWGDRAYSRHLAALGQASIRRRAGGALCALVLVALALVWTQTIRVVDPDRFAIVTSPGITSPGVTSPRVSATTSGDLTVTTTGSETTRSPSQLPIGPPLANTGAHDGPMLGVAAIVIACGVALGASRRRGGSGPPG